jgi:transposase
LAVDTLGNLLALLVTPANEQDRPQVAALAKHVQEVTGDSVEVAFVDQAYTGEQAAELIQKETPSGPRRADHLGQRFLTDLRNHPKILSLLFRGSCYRFSDK